MVRIDEKYEGMGERKYTYESGVDFDAFVSGSVVAGDLEPDGHLIVVEAHLNETLVVELDALWRLFELAFR